MSAWKLVPVFAVFFALSGCDTLARIALEGATDSRIRYGSHCQTLRMQCRAENYREWETADGKMGCSCDGPSGQQRYPGGNNEAI